jgi:hypothetical protein
MPCLTYGHRPITLANGTWFCIRCRIPLTAAQARKLLP